VGKVPTCQNRTANFLVWVRYKSLLLHRVYRYTEVIIIASP
jgi:hypothetical protein